MDNHLGAILSESSRNPADHRHLSWSTTVSPFVPPERAPGTALPSRCACTVHPQALCTATYTHDLARAGVIGACSHAGPGRGHVPGRPASPGRNHQPWRPRRGRCTAMIYLHTAVHRLWLTSHALHTCLRSPSCVHLGTVARLTRIGESRPHTPTAPRAKATPSVPSSGMRIVGPMCPLGC